MTDKKICLNCDSEITSKSAKKFCSNSCAAIYNNKRKPPRTEMSKLKTSATMKSLFKEGKISPVPPENVILYEGPHTKISRKTCTHCKKDFWAKNRWTVTCSEQCRYSRSAFNNVKKQHIKFYNRFEKDTVTLHSNWEVKIAQWLDDNDIEWYRPKKTLNWYDGTKNRKYTPDFFIVSCSLFVDVKNPLKVKQDFEKLSILKQSYNLLVGNIEECQQGILAALP